MLKYKNSYRASHEYNFIITTLSLIFSVGLLSAMEKNEPNRNFYRNFEQFKESCSPNNSNHTFPLLIKRKIFDARHDTLFRVNENSCSVIAIQKSTSPVKIYIIEFNYKNAIIERIPNKKVFVYQYDKIKATTQDELADAHAWIDHRSN